MQSFQITVDLVAAAEGDEAWGGPALHTLLQLRHMLGSAHLAQLLPALLRLQRNHQVWFPNSSYIAVKLFAF